MRQRNAGFTLVEVLVAMFILGAGLLGTAMIQIKSTKHIQKSLVRSQSSMLAVEIVERMRINYDEATGESYDILMTATKPTVTEDCGTTTAVCSSTELATFDLNQWLTRVAAVLPSGDASVDADPDATPPEARIEIQYTNESTTEKHTYLLSLQ